jgi:2-hydroxymuconate-semialdehyde hydrolase
MRAILRANFHDPAWAQDDAYVKRRVEASLAPGAWEAVAAARLKPPTAPPRREFGRPDTIDYERIRFPTLVMAGAEDKLRLPSYHEALGRIPDSRIVVLAEAGHLLNIEKAGEFNDLVRQFLLDRDAHG